MGEVELKIKDFGIVNDSFKHSRAPFINCLCEFLEHISLNVISGCQTV